ncbi:MAG: DUF2914 domain-containing protein [Actinomycetota bacterium]
MNPSVLADHPAFRNLKRYAPMLAFFGGFLWDALTLGRKVKVLDFWVLGGYLLGAAVFIYWLARRDFLSHVPPEEVEGMRGRWNSLVWQAPYLLVQFFFGGIFSALFILYFKSSNHIGAWLMALFLGGLLVGNEFMKERYGRRFTTVWGLFGLNAILLFNFVLPHLAGSLHPGWFYLSTGLGGALAHGLRWISPGRPGRILPAWCVAGALVLAWNLDMIAPVPLVNREVVIGHNFDRTPGRFALRVEKPPFWQFWRDWGRTVHVPEGERIYGVSAVFAPLGVTAPLEHRWEYRDPSSGWRQLYQARFSASGGRERGFRGYSYVTNPKPGEWRLVVATQDGRTIAVQPVTVERGDPIVEEMVEKEF